MTTTLLDWSILGPALAAGLLVLSTHVPLGRQVLARGIIFIDLAIAQIAGIGVLAAHAAGWETDGWATQAVATAAALTGAVLLYGTERRLAAVQEAIIGSVFVLAAAGGILLLAANPQSGEHLKQLLAGQILWVNYRQLIPVALLYALILLAWFGWRDGGSFKFYVLFALTVTASVQLVGVYLVFASLILPALAVRVLDDRRGLALCYATGAVGYGVGIVASAPLDLPTGPLTVFTLAGAALLGAAAATYFSSSTRRGSSFPGKHRKGTASGLRS